MRRTLCVSIIFMLTVGAVLTASKKAKDDGVKNLKPIVKPCEHIVVGDDCEQDKCQPCGYCWNLHSFYYRCNRTFPDDPKLYYGKYVHEACDPELWWNPDLRSDEANITLGEGGSCDRWEFLSEEVQQAYLNDPNCVTPVSYCEWGQDPEDKCTGWYWYFNPAIMEDRQNLKCPDNLIYDPAVESCRICSNMPHCNCSTS